MPNVTIDTSDPTYQQFLDQYVNQFRPYMTPRVALFLKCNQQQRQWWLNNDPLMREFAKDVKKIMMKVDFLDAE